LAKNKYDGWIGAAVLATVVGIVIYAGFLLRVHLQIAAKAEEEAKFIVTPAVDDQSVSEVGYIIEVRKEDNFEDRRLDIRWWVKVPSTGKTYSCFWEGGYSRFSKDDGVRIIHKMNDPDTADHTGYIIGINGEQAGHSAMVWALDEDYIEFLSRPGM
jgi:hypothetical protein